LSTTNPTCQTRARTRAAAVGSQRLTASAMARPITQTCSPIHSLSNMLSVIHRSTADMSSRRRATSNVDGEVCLRVVVSACWSDSRRRTS
jgi:hypothetical protein